MCGRCKTAPVDPSAIRSRLINERKKRHWNQQFVADMVEVSRRAYQNYENGTRDPALGTVNRLEDLFNIPQRELLAREDVPTAFYDKAYEQESVQAVHS